MTRGTRKHLKAVKRRRALKERYPRIAGTRRRFEGPVVSALTQGGRPSLLRPPPLAAALGPPALLAHEETLAMPAMRQPPFLPGVQAGVSRRKCDDA